MKTDPPLLQLPELQRIVPEQLLTARDVCTLTRIGRRTLDTMVADGRFPAPDVRDGKVVVRDIVRWRYVRWRFDTVKGWIETLQAATAAGGGRA